ncbi:MAG: phenylacetic acid degradation protein [Actinobacteria bacterium 13_1_20CM_3_71_11]|nr:MAG: phenylacetic acid degradation protein [Actinobacteria bacterium 13_1_20CM_3_71_11]
MEFAVPEELREQFAFRAGQHLTVRRIVDGEDARRSYSICSTPAELAAHGRVRIGVRAVAEGVFSTYALTALQPGDTVDVLPPLGHFTTDFEPSRARHYAAIVAGSGITPVLSLVATALAVEPASHVLSREAQEAALLSGRLDEDRLRALFDTLIDPAGVDEWFLCGPYGLVTGARKTLAERGVPEATVRAELFHVTDEPPPPRPPEEVAGEAEVTIVLDGRTSTFRMGRDERVLDAALKVRPELPYACRGGVCSTCRARLVDGEVTMARNYALEPDETAAGYVLTCQSSPLTDRLTVDYDG